MQVSLFASLDTVCLASKPLYWAGLPLRPPHQPITHPDLSWPISSQAWLCKRTFRLQPITKEHLPHLCINLREKCFNKGRVSQFFIILPLIPWGNIYGGKIFELVRSDPKMVRNCKISSFLGLKIWRFFFGGVMIILLIMKIIICHCHNHNQLPWR